MSDSVKLDPPVKQSLHMLRQCLYEFFQDKEILSDAIISCLISSGHLLLEDVPGVGKTTFIKALAKLLGLKMKRIQFTSDLLPSDILGIQIYDLDSKTFAFHEGPVFANVVLADELNRASPKTQSALLEAMGERSVTVDRKTWILPQPFIVVAAQNPSDHMGTFPIPESQLDRFSIKVKLDYPGRDQELEIFSKSSLDPLQNVPEGIIMRDELIALQDAVDRIHVSKSVATCVKEVVDASRIHPHVQLGISTRGGVQWVRLAKARAIIEGRDYITPDDLNRIAAFCLPHRMIFTGGYNGDVVEELLKNMVI